MTSRKMIPYLCGVLLTAGIAWAQQEPPATVAAPGETTVTSTTTTTTGGTDVIGAEPSVGTMPTTGGAPLAMMLAGGLTAAGAFLLRRKLDRCSAR